MSLPRALLVVVQAVCNQVASTPPNPTPTKLRYHTDEHVVLQIAPLIFGLHRYVFWICAILELVFYLHSAHLFPIPPDVYAVLYPGEPNIKSTRLFVIGVLAALLGTYIRLDCFHALGHLFTFDLTVHPDHKLITNRFYAYVRHPSYTGSILLIIGLTFSHLTPGSYLTECRMGWRYAIAFTVVWWAWTWSVGISRAAAEDKQMKKLFGSEWDFYAARVPWWFFPGLY